MKAYVIGGIGICLLVMVTTPLITMIDRLSKSFFYPMSSYYLFSMWLLAIIGVAVFTNRKAKDNVE